MNWLNWFFSGIGVAGGQFWSSMFGAIAGALVSSGVAWWMQYSGARVARKERLPEKDQRDLAMAQSVVFKLIEMKSVLHHIDGTIGQAKEKLGDVSWDKNFWLFVLPIANNFPFITLERDEQSFIAGLKVNGLTGSIIEAIKLYNDFISIMTEYGKIRIKLFDRISDRHDKASTATGKQLLPDDVLDQAYSENLRAFAATLLSRSSKELSLADATLTKFVAVARTRFGDAFGQLRTVVSEHIG